MVTKLYLFHDPIDSTLLTNKQSIIAFSQRFDNRRYKDEKYGRLIKDYFEKYKDRIKGRVLTDKNFEAIIKVLKTSSQNDNWLMLYSATNLNFKALERTCNIFNAKLYGSSLNPQKIQEMTRYLSDKVNSLFFLRKISSKNMIPDTTVATTEDLEEIIQNKDFPLVIKADHGEGGFGSSILRTPKEISSLDWLIKNKEFNRNDRWIIEPYLDNWGYYCSFVFLGDDSIEFGAVTKGIVEGLSYRGNIFPVKTSQEDKIKEVTLRIAHIIWERGYRGFLNFDFLEKDGSLVISEINYRMPYSIYPVKFVQNNYPSRTPFLVETTNISNIKEGGIPFYFHKDGTCRVLNINYP